MCRDESFVHSTHIQLSKYNEINTRQEGRKEGRKEGSEEGRRTRGSYLVESPVIEEEQQQEDERKRRR